MLVQIPNSHSLGLKTMNNSVTEMKIAFVSSPEQSSLSLTGSLKLLITLPAQSQHIISVTLVCIFDSVVCVYCCVCLSPRSVQFWFSVVCILLYVFVLDHCSFGSLSVCVNLYCCTCVFQPNMSWNDIVAMLPKKLSPIQYSFFLPVKRCGI